MPTCFTTSQEGELELKGTRHLIVAWVPIIITATALGSCAGMAFHLLAARAGVQQLYLDFVIASLSGVLGLIFVLKKHHIPVRGLPD